MPPPRKIDLLPPELKRWLQDALRARGFGGYEDLADDLNARLSEAGSEIRIRKSALHDFGQEYREFVRYQEQASAWARDWMQEMGLEDQVQRQGVLFQMLTTLAFKVMQSEITKEGEDISPQNLHFLGRMMKDVMSSSGIVQQMRDRERKDQATRLEAAVAAGDIDAVAADKARRILGFA